MNNLGPLPTAEEMGKAIPIEGFNRLTSALQRLEQRTGRTLKLHVYSDGSCYLWQAGPDENRVFTADSIYEAVREIEDILSKPLPSQVRG